METAGQPVNRRLLVTLLLAVIPFSQIPMDAYTPAMPDMVHELASTSNLIQNTVTSYLLGMSLALVPVGMLSDAWGRKRTLLLGMSILVLASIACALATNVWLLIGLRFVQGVAGSACMVVTYAIAADCFRGAELTSISGLLGIA